MGSKISSVRWFGSYFWSGQVGFLGPSYVLLGTFPLNLFHLFLFLKAFSCPRVSHPVCFYTCLGETRSRREIQSILVLEGAGRQHPWFSQTYKILIKSCSGIKGILVGKSDRVITKQPVRALTREALPAEWWFINMILTSALLKGHCLKGQLLLLNQKGLLILALSWHYRT